MKSAVASLLVDRAGLHVMNQFFKAIFLLLSKRPIKFIERVGGSI